MYVDGSCNTGIFPSVSEDSESSDVAGTGGGSSNMDTTGLWSEVVYEGTEVYEMLLILECSGEAALSV